MPEAASTVTVLGSSSSTPRPGRACSCYLVRAGDTAIALDLGTGSLSNLRRYVAPEDMSAVIISHMHPDHFLDVIPMRYALRYGPRAHARRVPLYLPPGGDTLLRRMTDVFSEEPPVDFLAVYDVRTYDPGAALERTVDAHVKSLRAKLKEVRPEADPIETHRGFGYSLREET